MAEIDTDSEEYLDSLENSINEVSGKLPNGGDMTKTREAQAACNSALGTDFLSMFGIGNEILKLYSIYKNAESTIKSTKEDVKKNREKIKEHNKNAKSDKDKIEEPDESREERKAKRRALRAANKLANDSSSSASKFFDSLKGTLSSQVSAFTEEAKNLFTQSPIQLGIVSANPFTAPSVVIVILQILAIITSLLNTASNIIAFALLINVPLPNTMNEAIIKLAGLKKMLSFNLPFSIPLPEASGDLKKQIDDACDEATKSKEESENCEVEGILCETESNSSLLYDDYGINDGYNPSALTPEDTKFDQKFVWEFGGTPSTELTGNQQIFAYKSKWFMKPDGSLSTEMYYSATATKYKLNNEPPLNVQFELRKLIINLLDPLRNIMGPIYVSSGYRSTALNNKLAEEGKEVSNDSQHILGQAVDLQIKTNKKVDKNKNRELYNLIRDKFSFDQLIDESDFLWVHVSFVSYDLNRKMELKK